MDVHKYYYFYFEGFCLLFIPSFRLCCLVLSQFHFGKLLSSYLVFDSSFATRLLNNIAQQSNNQTETIKQRSEDNLHKVSLFYFNTFFVCVMNKRKFFGDGFFCNIFSWVVWNIHINQWSLLNRVPQALQRPSNWVPLVTECPKFSSSAPMPKYLSSQVPKCPLCRSA